MERGVLIGKMITLATAAHAGQFDKAQRPYILHCLAVLNILNSDDEELQCIAVGHDLFEDTKVTIEDLVEEGFTERVVTGILRMTKMPGESYKQYVEKVLDSKDAMIVESADLKHNSDITRLKGISDKDIERTAKYMKFYTTIQAALAKG